MLPNNSLSFIANIVKGIQSSKKELILIQYFKDKIGSTGVLLLQETYSYSKVEQKWKEDVKGQVFFSSNVKFLWRLTAYFGTEKCTVKKQQTDKEGHILILDVPINNSEYILINLYSAKTAKEQIDVLSNLLKLLEEFDTNKNTQLIMAWNFNLFFDSKLDKQSGNPTLKKKSLAKLIEFKETYELCDICRVRNTNSKRFTFTQKHSSCFIQLRLNYILISNTLQEFVTMTEILIPISIDYSPVLFLSQKKKCY